MGGRGSSGDNSYTMTDGIETSKVKFQWRNEDFGVGNLDINTFRIFCRCFLC